MKTIDTSLLYSNRRALFMRATRQDGAVYGFSGAGQPVLIDELLYEKLMVFSNIVLTADTSVNNGEIRWNPDGEVVTIEDILRKKWDNFSYVIFETDWKNPVILNEITGGTSGEVSMRDGQYVVEVRGLKQALRNPQGLTTQTICRNRFADHPFPFKPKIRCNLDIAAFTVTGTLTGSANRYSATDSVRGEVSDWFGLGTMTITSAGPNQGEVRQIATYEGGVFTFTRPFFEDLAPGDEYEATAGCRGRHEITLLKPDGISDCKTKFNNVVNFQGEPHTPGVDAVTRGASTGG